jgi:serine/threonine-protein kinase RsbW
MSSISILNNENELHIVIPSSIEYVGPIMSFLNALFRNKGIDDAVVANVVTSVIEAIANAITHGNHSDLHKKIDILIAAHQNILNIEVQDEGNGFDVATLPNPLTPENILKTSGRGIFLIKAFMDSVAFDFSGIGTRLIMKKVFERSIE